MNEVFLRTRLLGEALLESDEFKAVKQAEQKAMANQEAAQTVGRFIELRNEMDEIMRADSKDWVRVQKLTEEIDECKRAMDENEDLVELDRARNTFSELINQINSVLHFIVTGEMETEDSSCSGDCTACGGCSAKVN